MSLIINCILAGSVLEWIEVHGRECHGMELGPQFLTLWNKNESVHFDITTLSEDICSVYLPGSCTNIPAKKSLTSLGHHVMMLDII